MFSDMFQVSLTCGRDINSAIGDWIRSSYMKLSLNNICAKAGGY